MRGATVSVGGEERWRNSPHKTGRYGLWFSQQWMANGEGKCCFYYGGNIEHIRLVSLACFVLVVLPLIPI